MNLLNMIPEPVQATWKLRAFGLLKAPLIGFLMPKILEVDARSAVVKIPLNYRSKNHLNSMYFGAMAIGAELAVGVSSYYFMGQKDERIVLVFKGFEANYLRRAEGDVHFICKDVPAVEELVNTAAKSDVRVQAKIPVIATVPDVLGDEPVAEFNLILSLKKK